MSKREPTLWQIQVSHYSEKVRWALAHKGVEHRRRTPVPGSHMPIALWLTRGRQITFPVIEMDGRRIGDSTAIIAALEERYPDPPLYPADPEQRERALALEDFFDEEVGPHTRRVAFHELIRDPERLAPILERTTPPPMNRMKRSSMAYAKALTGLRFAAGSRSATERSRSKIIAGINRLEQELGDGEYLVGDTFTVADLTAASLFYPLVLPDEGPLPPEDPPPRGLQRFREPLEDRRGFKWVAEMFRRHRKPAAMSAAA